MDKQKKHFFIICTRQLTYIIYFIHVKVENMKT